MFRGNLPGNLPLKQLSQFVTTQTKPCLKKLYKYILIYLFSSCIKAKLSFILYISLYCTVPKKKKKIMSTNLTLAFLEKLYRNWFIWSEYVGFDHNYTLCSAQIKVNWKADHVMSVIFTRKTEIAIYRKQAMSWHHQSCQILVCGDFADGMWSEWWSSSNSIYLSCQWDLCLFPWTHLCFLFLFYLFFFFFLKRSLLGNA